MGPIAHFVYVSSVFADKVLPSHRITREVRFQNVPIIWETHAEVVKLQKVAVSVHKPSAAVAAPLRCHYQSAFSVKRAGVLAPSLMR
jgi:hypothetical protein